MISGGSDVVGGQLSAYVVECPFVSPFRCWVRSYTPSSTCKFINPPALKPKANIETEIQGVCKTDSMQTIVRLPCLYLDPPPDKDRLVCGLKLCRSSGPNTLSIEVGISDSKSVNTGRKSVNQFFIQSVTSTRHAPLQATHLAYAPTVLHFAKSSEHRLGEWKGGCCKGMPKVFRNSMIERDANEFKRP